MKSRKNYRTLFFVIIILIAGTTFVVLTYVKKGQPQELTSIDNGSTTEKTNPPKKTKVFIHICGRVKKPDVYDFNSEPRLNDVVRRAGGFAKGADKESINLAEVISDGTRIEIPKKESHKNSKSKEESQTKNDENKINLNSATKERLLTLTGIGESKADAIIRYRKETGRFQKIEDIMKISGIKNGVFQKVKDKLCV